MLCRNCFLPTCNIERSKPVKHIWKPDIKATMTLNDQVLMKKKDFRQIMIVGIFPILQPLCLQELYSMLKNLDGAIF